MPPNKRIGQKPRTIGGPEYFGFGNKLITALIEGLDNSTKCSNYYFLETRGTNVEQIFNSYLNDDEKGGGDKSVKRKQRQHITKEFIENGLKDSQDDFTSLNSSKRFVNEKRKEILIARDSIQRERTMIEGYEQSLHNHIPYFQKHNLFNQNLNNCNNKLNQLNRNNVKEESSSNNITVKSEYMSESLILHPKANDINIGVPHKLCI